MATCPICKIGLQSVRQREGLYYYCNQCNGRAVTVPQIRHVAGDRFASGLIRKMSRAVQVSSRECPFCLSPMKSFEVSDPPVTLESCKPCVTVWFDAGKFDVMPEGVFESPDEVLLTAAEAEAKRKMQEEWVLGEGFLAEEPPDKAWKYILAAIPLNPVKYHNVEMSRRPWTTWSLSALIFIVSVCTFHNLDSVADKFAFSPEQPLRYGGATFITAFFLHGGWEHVLGNLYFFLLFGNEVEDLLGWWRFLALIFSATIVGDLFHMVGDPGADLIGASGGISGVLIFYACQFPKARLAFFFWFLPRSGWVRVQAWGLFLFWFLLQLLGAIDQVNGFSSVSSLAHIGGVTTGFLFWLAWKKRGLKKTVET